MSYKTNGNVGCELDVLEMCIEGKPTSKIGNTPALNRLATVGFVRFGTEIVHDSDGTIELHRTVKATNLGKLAYKNR